MKKILVKQSLVLATSLTKCHILSLLFGQTSRVLSHLHGLKCPNSFHLHLADAVFDSSLNASSGLPLLPEPLLQAAPDP